MKNVPNLRFSSFNDEWKEQKLGEFAEIVGGGTPSTSVPEYWDGNIDWYAPAEIKDQRFVSDSVRKITELGLQRSSAKILPADKTVLFTSRAGIGKTAIMKKPGATNQGFQSLVLHDDINPYFVYSKSSEIKEKAEQVASGSTFLEISGKMLGELTTNLPQKDEQDLIADTFERLDDIIAAQQQKYENLIALKSACLEKMFPQKDSAVPELRLKGFTDLWEEHKLEEFVTFFSGLTYSPNDVSDSGVLVLRSSNVKNDEIVDADNVYVFPDVVNSDYVRKGDIVIVVRNGSRSLIGKHAKVKKDMPNTVIGAFMTGIRCEHSSFVNALLNTSCFDAQITANMGATINQITGYMFSNMSFYIPSEEEQDAIGDYFDKLESLICYTQKRLDKLKQFKQAMLNSMLV